MYALIVQHRLAGAVCVAALGLAAAIGVRAQAPSPAASSAQGAPPPQQAPPPGQQPAPQPPARPMIPMTAASLVRDPAPYIGENVSLMASVEAVLSKTAFSIDQNKAASTGQDVLVIVQTLSATPELNAYVTVQGEVIRFDPAEVVKRNKNFVVDLPPELIEKYRGKPAILATAVITTGLVDLAKKPIPPMSPAEQAFSQLMKAIQPAVTAVRAGLEKPDAAQLTDQAVILKKSFTDVEAFFKARGTADAIGWSGEALKHVTTIEAGIAASKWDDVKAAAGSLQQLCTQCHTQHRERMDDGSYRIKGG
jgi:hypothetical protein